MHSPAEQGDLPLPLESRLALVPECLVKIAGSETPDFDLRNLRNSPAGSARRQRDEDRRGCRRGLQGCVAKASSPMPPRRARTAHLASSSWRQAAWNGRCRPCVARCGAQSRADRAMRQPCSGEGLFSVDAFPARLGPARAARVHPPVSGGPRRKLDPVRIAREH